MLNLEWFPFNFIEIYRCVHLEACFQLWEAFCSIDIEGWKDMDYDKRGQFLEIHHMSGCDYRKDYVY